MKRRFIVIGICCSVIILAGLCLVSCSSENIQNCTLLPSEPNITPDYSGVVIPPNIAPMNFRILEKALAYHVKIHSESWHSWSSNSRLRASPELVRAG